MISSRTLLLLALALGGYWAWQSGAWRDLAAGVADARSTGETASARPLPEPQTAPQPAVPAQPATVLSWRDKDGVTHFASAGEIPRHAEPKALRGLGTMADYDRALEAEKGLTPADIQRARQSLAQPAAAPADTTANAPSNGASVAETATAQARDLLQRYEQSLEQIRQENAR